MALILIVEDNDMNRDMLSRRLQKRGHETILAVDGLAGLSMAVSESPDLVLLDMSLPEMDGWEVARRLKSDTRTSGVPVIALTAHTMEGDREKGLQAGCDDYDTKPVDIQRLMDKITALLGSGPAQNAGSNG